jgi:hypothetical protein
LLVVRKQSGLLPSSLEYQKVVYLHELQVHRNVGICCGNGEL